MGCERGHDWERKVSYVVASKGVERCVMRFRCWERKIGCANDDGRGTFSVVQLSGVIGRVTVFTSVGRFFVRRLCQ